jgi:hypothetical protein
MENAMEIIRLSSEMPILVDPLETDQQKKESGVDEVGNGNGNGCIDIDEDKNEKKKS